MATLELEGAPAAAAQPTDLAGRVNAARARVVDLQRRQAEISAERTRLEDSRPELAAAAHVRGDPKAKDQLKALNARLLEVESASEGFNAVLTQERADLDELEAELTIAESLARLERAEADAVAAGTLRDRSISQALAKLDELVTTIDAAISAHDRRQAALGTVRTCLNDMGGGSAEHPWPDREGENTAFQALRRALRSKLSE